MAITEMAVLSASSGNVTVLVATPLRASNEVSGKDTSPLDDANEVLILN